MVWKWTRDEGDWHSLNAAYQSLSKVQLKCTLSYFFRTTLRGPTTSVSLRIWSQISLVTMMPVSFVIKYRWDNTWEPTLPSSTHGTQHTLLFFFHAFSNLSSMVAYFVWMLRFAFTSQPHPVLWAPWVFTLLYSGYWGMCRHLTLLLSFLPRSLQASSVPVGFNNDKCALDLRLRLSACWEFGGGPHTHTHLIYNLRHWNGNY